MALFKPYKILSNKLSSLPVKEGQLIVTTDTGDIYVDLSNSERKQLAVTDLSNYVTSNVLISSIAAEAQEREKQDGLLEDVIEGKLDVADLVEGSNITISADGSGHVTITASVPDVSDFITETEANAAYATKSHTHSVATDSTNGFMSATDKEKLDGIATGANKYTLPTASSSTLGGVKIGANITNSLGTISITKANVTAALGYTPPTTNTTYSNMTGATSDAAGEAGLVPAPAAGAATRYLRSDGTWQVPPNTTYTLSSFGITATAAELNKLDGCTATVTELNYVDGVTSNIQTQLNGKAASSHNHSAANITSGTLAVARGGTGITANPSMLVNLGSTSTASVFATSPRPGITGTLAVGHGGTGATSAASARSNLGAAASDIVTVSSTKPSSSTCKLWIKP